ncbi:MAG: MotA/TolQ/ExbB proton channel family protein [Betaproteobacteria bacterium]|nr:MotA/TolQ/ExbB proton channel family protein [Betaproteobacteria bacterium]
MNQTTTLGFGHFIAQSDTLAKILLLILLLMSVISWTLILQKGIASLIRKQRSKTFLGFFWNAPSLDAVAAELAARGARCPFSHLAAQALHALKHHTRFGTARLEEAGTRQEFLSRTMRKVIDEETTRLENGLTALATIGSTAPFVGLFGTVWGVYHALVAIGMSGSGTLDKVAGPVGEALIMTAVGLAVAIPAVIGYNWLTRSNRVLLARIDAFAHELFTFLSLGHLIAPPEQHPESAAPEKSVTPPRVSERAA